jgi:hypothetical protein
MTTEEVWIGENDVRRKLEGDELAEFLADRARIQAIRDAAQTQADAAVAAKLSAIAKLEALGLTEDEAKAIIG